MCWWFVIVCKGYIWLLYDPHDLQGEVMGFSFFWRYGVVGVIAKPQAAWVGGVWVLGDLLIFE